MQNDSSVTDSKLKELHSFNLLRKDKIEKQKKDTGYQNEKMVET